MDVNLLNNIILHFFYLENVQNEILWTLIFIKITFIIIFLSYSAFIKFDLLLFIELNYLHKCHKYVYLTKAM